MAAQVTLPERQVINERPAEKVRPVDHSEGFIEATVVGIPGATRRAKLAAVRKVIDLLAECVGDLRSQSVSEAPVQSNLQGVISRVAQIAGITAYGTVLRI